MEQRDPFIYHKINTKATYKVYSNTRGGHTYYNVAIEKRNYDKSKDRCYRQLKFAKCYPPENGEIIKITNAFEDFYPNPKDPYNPIITYVVLDYIKVDNSKAEKERAISEYQQSFAENSIDDDALPF